MMRGRKVKSARVGKELSFRWINSMMMIVREKEEENESEGDSHSCVYFCCDS